MLVFAISLAQLAKETSGRTALESTSTDFSGRYMVPTAAVHLTIARVQSMASPPFSSHAGLAIIGRADRAHLECRAMSRDGSTITSGGQARVITIWDARSLSITRTFQAHSSPIFGLAFSGDARLLASASFDAPRAYGIHAAAYAWGTSAAIPAVCGRSPCARTAAAWLVDRHGRTAG